jgi:hypothetical protein
MIATVKSGRRLTTYKYTNQVKRSKARTWTVPPFPRSRPGLTRASAESNASGRVSRQERHVQCQFVGPEPGDAVLVAEHEQQPRGHDSALREAGDEATGSE